VVQDLLRKLPKSRASERMAIDSAVRCWKETVERDGDRTSEGRGAFDRITRIVPLLIDSYKQLHLPEVLKEIERLSPQPVAKRAHTVLDLRAPSAPYCTISELRDLTSSTLAALIQNKTAIAKDGHLPNGLADCGWLSSFLTTYPRLPLPAREGDPTTHESTYFTKMGPEVLQVIRAKLIALKSDILRDVQTALGKDTSLGLWKSCLGRLRSTYTAIQFRRFETLDSQFAATAEHWHSSADQLGTLRGLLWLVGFFEVELSKRVLDQTKRALQDASFNPREQDYFEVLGTPHHAAVAAALDTFETLKMREEKVFWPEFWERVERAVEEEFDHKVNLRFRVPGRFCEDSRLLMESTARIHRESLLARDRFADGEALLPLTKKEWKECEERNYKFYGLVVIRPASDGSNDVSVSLGGRPERLTLEPAISFLHLVKEACKKPGNFLPAKDIGVAHPHQRVEEIRKALGDDESVLIETQKGRGYRLSVHPRLIRYDKQALLEHGSTAVNDLAKVLSECADEEGPRP
jgi:hypothetical protein